MKVSSMGRSCGSHTRNPLRFHKMQCNLRRRRPRVGSKGQRNRRENTVHPKSLSKRDVLFPSKCWSQR